MQTKTSNLMFDRSTVLARLGNDEDFLHELLESFVEDVQGKLMEIKTHIQESNYEAIRIIAHTLKGTTSYLAVFKMQDAVIQMENAVKTNDLKSVSSFVEVVENEHKKLKEYLNIKAY